MKTRTIVTVACLTIVCILAIPISHLTAQNPESARQESEARPVGYGSQGGGEKSGPTRLLRRNARPH